jgi:hypothetical protein
MVVMKEKMGKLKASLEDYGEKLGVVGRKRLSIVESRPGEQEVEVGELIKEVLRTIDVMGEVQR